jgi:type VI secretion system protein VasG
MNVELKSLLGKMNNVCRTALESAIHFAITKKKNSVELELWLIKLLEKKKTAISAILEHYGVSISEVLQQIYSPAYHLTDNNSDVPSLDRELVDSIQKSWLIASVEFNSSSINSGHLFYVILLDPVAVGLSPKLAKLFTHINTTELKEQFTEILKRSDEYQVSTSLSFQNISDNNSIAKFTNDLVELARQSKLDRAIAREHELNQVIDILCRRKQNNPLLVGEAGVGKTAIVEELAFRLLEDSVPDILKGATLKSLDIASMQAGANIKGEFEQRLKSILSEIKKSSNTVILFIDEIHNIMGAGSGGAAQNDLANLLKPELARGDLFVIGATTWGEYKKFFEKDAALKRRFQLVKVMEQSELESISILRNVAELLENYHGVKITEKAVEQAVKLSTKYITEKHLPDKAISLLDSACARVKLSQTIIPLELEQLQREITLLKQHIKRLKSEIDVNNEEIIGELANKVTLFTDQYQKDYDNWQQKIAAFEGIKGLKTQETRELYLAKKQELAKLGGSPVVYTEVDEKVIANVVSSWTGIPIPTQDTTKDEVNYLLNLESKIHKRVVGQDYAINKIIQNVRIAKANIADPRKPLGVFLLVGESGTGKTETALSIAETVYGHESKIITINMSEYKESHKISSLIGSPPGYVGYGEGGKLTEQVRKNPYSVLLLDEMEKAHKDVQELFLQVFDKGTLTDSEGVVVNFKNTVIIMTSNACAHKVGEFYRKSKKFKITKLVDHLGHELLAVFKPEFLGRVNIVPYLPLDDKVLEEIIAIQFAKIAARVKEYYGTDFAYSSDVASKIINECKASKIGARAIEQIISGTILPDLSVKLLESRAVNKIPLKLFLSVKDSKFLINLI